MQINYISAKHRNNKGVDPVVAPAVDLEPGNDIESELVIKQPLNSWFAFQISS
jgi:hypothetical protein